MKRRLLNVLTALSLLLFVAVVAVWVRSYFAAEYVWYQPAGRVIELIATKGKLECYRARFGANSRFAFTERFGRRPGPPWDIVPGGPGSPGGWNFAGFGHVRVVDASGDVTMDVVPLWALVLAAAVAPALGLRRRLLRRARGRTGLCPVCGYDLRATPDRCPECGTKTDLPAVA
jgi:hypothetical protein